MIFGGYKASKLKPQLKMAVTRFQIAANKKSALMKQQIREIAKMLAEDPPKEEKARIKSEALIRDDNTVEVSFCPSYIMFTHIRLLFCMLSFMVSWQIINENAIRPFDSFIIILHVCSVFLLL